MKWEFFQQSLGMKKESGEEQLKELKALSDLQFMRDNVTKESVQTAQFSYPPLKALQAQPAERQSAQASPASAEAGTAPKPAATAIEMAKHASDCINSAAGMLQIIELFVKKGMPMPDNLRQVMSRTMEQSVAQVKLRTDQQSSSEARP
ncbi:hypothetical protein H4R22_000810 [Coemansia sp. RSA 1290]|nr:hypothetical protein H4R22_000810 [Coemansia sp. RSA 1290]